MAAALPVCYHGAISRKQCEDLLGKKNKDGAYLIRDSETIQGAMCLCVYKKKVVYTYRLLQTHNGHYTLMTAGGLEEVFFKNLDDLILHYKRRNQGLAMHLRHSVKRKTALLIQPQKPPEEPQRSPAPMSAPPAPEEHEEHDYENAPDLSEYVEVLPP
ncbi:SH2 domain-containing protein 1B2 EAT-2-related transducer [Collichthys lucidus]|uniref:SH2 domain-containing protein 1B2 EAT-2-related transducer n=1 Tax=Collichthys lucidus TaxID=240159 RepID=A0A4U5VI28_COLLU|nr:SH2 domain-containing protein 1B2 EAT-2-related transducer [Collichthys lucidus]TKS87410.1 SH2 domain-containing protein 1B2 EAT-2-related transducer [Collichthys lucidus]